ncbi:hypothetical protein Tco_1196314 [Tanacetum coccineum]
MTLVFHEAAISCHAILFQCCNIGMLNHCRASAKLLFFLDYPSLYVNQDCLYFSEPLLESGTILVLSVNSNGYSPPDRRTTRCSKDPTSEAHYPCCTVTLFPNKHLSLPHMGLVLLNIEGLFEEVANLIVNCLSLTYLTEDLVSMTKACDAQARDNLERVLECLDWKDVKHSKIASLGLTDLYASLQITLLSFYEEVDLSPSWKDAAIQCTAGSFSQPQNVSPQIPIPDWAKNPKKLSEAIDQVIVPDFQPKQGAKIETDENVTNLSS